MPCILRNVSGWETIVAAITEQVTEIGLDTPQYHVWTVDEAFNATEAVEWWIGNSTSPAAIPTAVFLYLFTEDVSALVNAAWLDTRLDSNDVVFYAPSLEIADHLLTLTWNTSATLTNSAEARQVFHRLFLFDSLIDFHVTSFSVVSYYFTSRAQFFAANITLSEVPGHPYSPRPSRQSFMGFLTGVVMMQLLSTMRDVTPAKFCEKKFLVGFM